MCGSNSQRYLQSSIRHLKWSNLQKWLTVKNYSMLNDGQGSEYPSDSCFISTGIYLVKVNNRNTRKKV